MARGIEGSEHILNHVLITIGHRPLVWFGAAGFQGVVRSKIHAATSRQVQG